MTQKTRNENSSDCLKVYYQHLKNIPLLSAEEEHELAIRIAQGDEKARNKLIESNLRLVIKIARLYCHFNVPLADLIQEGNMGLIKATEKFDYRKNVRFSTYAAWWIRQTITRSLFNSRRFIRLPHRKEELLRNAYKMSASLSQVLGREPTIKELADHLHVEETLLQDVMEISATIASLDSTQTDEDLSLAETFEDNTYNPEMELQRQALKEKTMQILSLLAEREQQVLMERFELCGSKQKTLKELGSVLAVSPETIRQIEKKGLKKLRSFSQELLAYM